MAESLQSQKMNDMPVGKLLLTMSLPAIISMFVQSLYNIVDSVFVSYYDTRALDAITIAYPLQLLMVAFAVGIGTGAKAMIARKLGEGKRDEATLTAKNALLMSLLATVFFAVMGLTISRFFVASFTRDSAIIDYGTQYLTIVMGIGLGVFVEICMSKSLQATGNMKIPMISQLIGAVTNIVLDPILIFGVGFIPSMGVKGAAIATVVGQLLSMVFVSSIMFFKKHDISMSFRGF